MRKYVIALILIVLCFNGLDNLRELSDLAIVRVIGIDYSEEDGYKVNVIVRDTTGKDNSEKGKIYEAQGKSVQEAVRYIVDESPKKLYIAHMQTLILSEKVAREKMENTLDFFIRDNEGSNNFYLFIAKENDVKDIIQTINEEKIDMKEMLLSSAKYRGNSNSYTLNDIIKDILRPGIDIIVNSCTLNNDKIEISDMAFFKSWNMLGFLDDEDSIIFNILNNNLENAIISVGEEDNLIVSEIISSKNNVKLDKEKNQVKMEINLDMNISETGKDIIIKTSETTDKIEEELEAEIKGRVDNAIFTMIDEYDTDLIGIGNLLYRKKDLLFNDSDYLKKVNIVTDVKVRILNQGGVIKKW